jgi:hypothetical protein
MIFLDSLEAHKVEVPRSNSILKKKRGISPIMKVPRRSSTTLRARIPTE